MGNPLRAYKRKARTDRKPIKGEDGKIVNGYYKKNKKDFIGNYDMYFEVLCKPFKQVKSNDKPK